MQARDVGTAVAPTALADEGAARAPLGDTIQLREILGTAEQAARGMLEAEEALRRATRRSTTP
jgi:hypothetical protein